MKSIFVEKKENYNTQSSNLLKQLKDQLNISDQKGLRILNRYDFEDPGEELYEKICRTIFSEPPVDHVYDEDFPMGDDESAFAVLYLPGQFDQRADSAAQCIQLITHGSREEIETARIYILKGDISEKDIARIKNYLINSVDSKEGSPWSKDKLKLDSGNAPEEVKTIRGFTSMDSDSLKAFHGDMSLSMSQDDLAFCQEYFSNKERRDPTLTELKVLDTYWSDHCRHTTFTTGIDDISFTEGRFNEVIQDAYKEYLETRKYVYGSDELIKDISLMDMAVIGMKDLGKRGLLEDLDVSQEINACSINIDVKVGDVILGYDLNANKKVNIKVLELESPVRDDYYIIEFKDGSKLEVTNEHPIYIKMKYGFQQQGDQSYSN